MFTGIIEEIGTINAIKRGTDSAKLFIDAKIVLENTKIGDSIAVNGVCLTVTSLTKTGFSADVMSETLNRTCFGAMHPGAIVNLERALPADGRFGGHIVSGHIDGVGEILQLETKDIARIITIKTSPALTKYIVEKGSVTLDGISLTVVKVGQTEFSISAIPHTLQNTNLHTKKIGSKVHIETDIIGKYVEKLILSSSTNQANQKGSGISREFLLENGF